MRVGGDVGRPSWRRLLVSLVATAGVMGIGYTFLSVGFLGSRASSAGEAIALAVAVMIWWAPVVCWAAWVFTVPVVLVVGVVAAVATHRYRPQPSDTRWRRVARRCRLALLIYGAWMVGVGAILLVSVAVI